MGAKDTEHNDHLKYRELAEDTRELLFQQQERYARVDGKAATHLSAVTVLVATVGFFCKWIISAIIPPASVLEWVVSVVGLACAIAVLVAWVSFFRVIRHHHIEFLRLDDEYLEFCMENLRVNVNYHIAKRSAEAFLSLKNLTHRKAELIAVGYRATLTSITLLAVLGIAYAVHQWSERSATTRGLQTEVTSMTDSDNKPTGVGAETSQSPAPGSAVPADGTTDDAPQSTSQPDTSIEGPGNIYLTESYDPDSLTTRTETAEEKSGDDDDGK